MQLRPIFVVLVVLVLVTGFLIYLPGLGGPLVLDDDGNLTDVTRYLEGEKTAQAVITDNRSGRLGRPIAMATFVLDAKLWGNNTWHAKRTNLLIHLASGVLVLILFRLLLRRTPGLSRHAPALALMLAAVWLLLPIHVSSVLYLVQRMALLSTFFVMAGLCWYMLARQAIERGKRWGVAALWIGVPIFTLLAAFSKENGILLPLLALVIELVWFRPESGERRPRSVVFFFMLGVLLPALMGVMALLFRPGSLIGGYTTRDFSLLDRLLTQPRVLWDYVAAVFVPLPANLGLFHDYYRLSTGLLMPPTTLFAIAGWLVVAVCAWIWRKRAPLFSGGIGIFLAAHTLESSIIPLEIYFEHRNYLASVGLLLAAGGLAHSVLSRVREPTPIFRRTLVALAVLAPTVYAAASFGRVQVWSDTQSFYAQELRHHPQSPRLRSYLLGFALNNADFFSAMTHIDAAERSFRRPDMMAPAFWRFLAYCAIDEPPPGELYDQLEARIGPHTATVDMLSWEKLAQRFESGECPGLDASRLAALVQRWLDGAELPPENVRVWRSRYWLARVFAVMENFEQAATIGNTAWRDADYNRGIGVFLFQVNASLGDETACRQILSRLEQSEGYGDLRFDQAVKTFREALETGLDNLPNQMDTADTVDL